MKYEEEEIKDQTTVLLILNTIIAIILGIIFMIIWCVDHVYAESYYLTVEDDDTQYISETVSSFPRTYTRNPGCTWGFPCISSPTVRFTLLENLTTANMYDFKGTIEMYYYGNSNYSYNTTGINCYYRQTNETLACNASVNFAKQSWTDISGQDMWKLTINYNITNVNPSTARSGIQIYIPKLNGSIYAWSINVAQPTYRSQIADNTDILTSSFESVGQGIQNSVNQSTTDITNNQNENTEKILEGLENQNKVCNDYNLRFDRHSDLGQGYLKDNGQVQSPASDWYYLSEYLIVNANSTYIIGGNGIYIPAPSASLCFYDKNKTMIDCVQYTSESVKTVIPSQDGFVRYSMYLPGDSFYTTFNGTYCYNALEKETEQMDEFLNYDHNFGSQSDTSYANTTHQNEETMTENLDGNLTNVDIDIDSDANGLIWNIIEHTVHANSVVFTMVIAILSLGIVKLVLGR